MSDDAQQERRRLIREFRQRLESLGRAGLDRIAAPPLPDLVRATARPVEPPAPGPIAVPIPIPIPSPEPMPRRPAPPEVAKPAPIAIGSLLGAEEPDVAASERPAALAALEAEVSVCTRCPDLAATRTRTVFGTGSATARLMFIGEAPGAEEDRTGKPFVGPAGALLTDMIKAMGLSRDEVFIANILKSRPPGNRDPLPQEVANCLPYLERQIAIVRPEFLCLLGRIAAQTLLETGIALGKLRGRWHPYRGIATVVTYHPSYLLRTPTAKKDAWADLRMLMQAMGLKPPDAKKP